jgi:hypothetical protein
VARALAQARARAAMDRASRAVVVLMARGPRKRKAIRPAPGDFILVGIPGVVMPNDWFLAKVLWIDGDDLVTEHTPPSGNGYRQILHVDRVRAIGSIAELVQFKERNRIAVHKLAMRVHKAESDLQAARDAVYARLDAIAVEVAKLP